MAEQRRISEKNTWPQLAALIFIMAAVAVILVSFPIYLHSSLSSQPFSDTDAFMRMVRVERLAETGNWFDNSFPRVNPPAGDVSHWTRPVDVTIIAFSWLFRGLFAPDRALWIAGVLIAPLYVFFLCLEVRACCAALGERTHWPIPALALLFSGGVEGYGQLGRPDHHILVALFVLMLYRSAYQILKGPERIWPAVRGGIAAALGTWVSIETIVVSVPLFGALGIVWLSGERGFARRAALLSAVWAAGCALALVIDPQNSHDRLAVIYDRLSVVHASIAAAAALGFGLLALLRARLDSLPLRLLASALIAASLLAGLHALFPDILGGPMTGVDPKAREIWLSKVSEMRPLRINGWPAAITFATFAGLAAAAFIVWVWRAARLFREGEESGSGNRRETLFFLISAAGLLALAIYGLRFALHAGVFAVFALAGPYFAFRRAAPSFYRIPAFLVRLTVTIAFIFGSLGLTFLLSEAKGALSAKAKSGYPAFIAKAPSGFLSCPVEKLGPFLDRLTGAAHPPLVLAHIDLGPGLLYFSRANVIATPYHRNGAGIVKAWKIFAAPDMGRAEARLMASGADYVLTCATRNEWSFYKAAPDSFHTRLLKGESFPFLDPVALPKDIAARMRLFRVKTLKPAPAA